MKSIISSKKNPLRLTPRKRLLILAFVLYVTFIILSRVPYIAENGTRQLKDNMDDEYRYYLIFEEDGRQSHYYAERGDTGFPGQIDLKYITNTHTLNVRSSNIKELSIYCKEVYYDEAQDVFKRNPYGEPDLLFIDYFKNERERFIVNVDSDTKIEELRFIDAPEPVSVLVNDVEWWKDGSPVHYKFENNDVVLTSVPSGENTKVVLYFKEILNPHATFKVLAANTIQEGNIIYGFINQEISFDASESHDDDDSGIIEKYKWDFGDDSKSQGENPKHEYSKTGTYEVILTVIDNDGLQDSYSKNITIIEDADDKDGDGMDDDWEEMYGLDPTDPSDANEDNDDDNLTNKQEHDNDPQTNPTSADTDGDDYTDYDEINTHKTDPTDSTSKPQDKKADEEDNTLMIMAIIAIIIIIIILVLLGLILGKRKKPEEAEGAVPPSQVPADEGVEGAGAPLPPPEPEQPSGEPMTDEDSLPVKGPPREPELAPPPDLGAIEGEEYQPLDLGFESPEGGMPGTTFEEPPPPPPGLPEDEYGEEEELPIGEEEGASLDEMASEMDGIEMPAEEEVPGAEFPVEPEIEGALEPELEGPPEEPLIEEEPEPAVEEEPEEDLPMEEPPEEATMEPEPTPPEDLEIEGELDIKEYVKKGALHFKNGEYSDAIIEWQKALDIEPDHPEIVESIQEAMKKLKEQ